MAHARVLNGRTVAVAASAAAHVGLFALFAWRLGETPPASEPPVMVVQLTPWPERPKLEPSPASSRAEPARRERGPTAVRPSPAAPADAPAPAPLVTDSAPVGLALRGLLDCRPANLDRLSSEERERCERRLAGDPALRTASGPRLNLDTSGRYAQDGEPYLARRPKKGCKVRAAGGADAMGKQGPVAGIACVLPF